MFRFQRLAPHVLLPADFALIFCYAALFLLFLVLSLQNFGEAGALHIHSSGTEYRYDLGRPQILEFEGPVGRTRVEINADGHARFIYSDCRDQICVLSGYLREGGHWAACLPNRVIARMHRSIDQPEVDAGAY